MTVNSLLLAGRPGPRHLSIVSARSYDIWLGTPANVANNALKAGEYKLKVEASNAVFTGIAGGKTFIARGQMENAPKQFDVIAIGTDKKSHAGRIQSVEPGGATTSIELSDSE